MRRKKYFGSIIAVDGFLTLGFYMGLEARKERIMEITVKQLKKLGACRDQVALFKETFGASAKVTLENCLIAAEAGLDIDWASRRLLTSRQRAAYLAATAPARAVYLATRAPARAAYLAATAPARAACLAATAPARAAHKAAKASAWAAYLAATAQAWADYEAAETQDWTDHDATKAPAWAAYLAAIAPAFFEASQIN